jgi:Mce-associated membrane protein
MDAQMRSSSSYYDVLGVAPTATSKEIRESYRRLLKQTHPDSGGSAALLDLVSEAYGVLIDPDERRQYDERNGFAGSAASPAHDSDSAVAEPTVAPETGVVEPPATGSRPRWLVPALAGLAVLLIVAFAAAGVTASRARAAAGAEQARVDALAAARSHAQAILSYDHRTLDADFARAQQVITGQFKSEYETTTTAVVRPTATEYKAVVKAEVTSAAVVRATSARAVVLVFVDQTTTSTRLDKAKRDSSRVRMTLVKEGGRWLVSEVDAL